MPGKSFTADLERFRDLTREKMTKVMRQSVDDVLQAAQTRQPGVKETGGTFELGKIPVDLGNLVASLASEVNGAQIAAGEASYTLALAQAEAGDVMRFAWTAPYALRIELGFSGEDALGRKYNVQGRHFVGQNAARWPEIVAANAQKVK